MANSNNTQGGRSTNGSTPRARGFAAMGEREQREIARKGGEAVSQNREHMSAIGRKGGEASHSNRNRGGSNAGRTLGNSDLRENDLRENDLRAGNAGGESR